MLLTFLIPSYNRVDSAYKLSKQIISQSDSVGVHDINVWVNDDASSNIDKTQIPRIFSDIIDHPRFCFSANDSNLGMSANILFMVSQVHSTFWSVISDDDQIMDGAISDIREALLNCSDTVSSLFVPRYSYNEKGLFRSKSACIKGIDKLFIANGPFNSLFYMDKAFILTGMFVRSQMTYPLWERHMSNGYFPVLTFAQLILEKPAIYLDKNWFIHIVDNITYWESWGATHAAQRLKLELDYLECIRIVYLNAMVQLRTTKSTIFPFFWLTCLFFVKTFLRSVHFASVVPLSIVTSPDVIQKLSRFPLCIVLSPIIVPCGCIVRVIKKLRRN